MWEGSAIPTFTSVPWCRPQLGDTSIMGTPERWVGKSIPEIVEMRSMLIRGMHRTSVKNVDGGKVEQMVKEIAIAEKYSNIDLKLKRAPSGGMSFNENSQPFGPSAPMESMSINSIKADIRLENAYHDDAMGAATAMLELYDKGVEMSKIQKALAAGTLGRKGETCVCAYALEHNRRGRHNLQDQAQGDKAVRRARCGPRIREHRARQPLDHNHGAGQLGVRVDGGVVSQHNVERAGSSVEIGASYEPFDGRKTYAEIGGCYYAARLAVSELLERKQAQAKVLILREVHSGYIMPVGVWNVREHVRQALTTQSTIFGGLDDALKYAATKLEIPLGTWMQQGKLLKRMIYQKRLALA